MVRSAGSFSTCHSHGMCCCFCVLSRVQLFATPWTVANQASLSMGFSRQEYWCRVPFSPSGDRPDPGIEPMSLAAPALAGGFFTTEPLGKPLHACVTWLQIILMLHTETNAFLQSLSAHQCKLCCPLKVCFVQGSSLQGQTQDAFYHWHNCTALS